MLSYYDSGAPRIGIHEGAHLKSLKKVLGMPALYLVCVTRHRTAT